MVYRTKNPLNIQELHPKFCSLPSHCDVHATWFFPYKLDDGSPLYSCSVWSAVWGIRTRSSLYRRIVLSANDEERTMEIQGLAIHYRRSQEKRVKLNLNNIYNINNINNSPSDTPSPLTWSFPIIFGGGTGCRYAMEIARWLSVQIPGRVCSM